MSNALVIALSQSTETFQESRKYLFILFGNSKDKVLQMESAGIDVCIPYYISFIESRGINFQEAMNHFSWEVPNSLYWDLVKIVIVNTFKKIENKDFNFIPY